MRIKLICFLCLVFLAGNALASGFSMANDPRFMVVIKEQMLRLKAEYLQFMAGVIVPAMRQGAGGSKLAPIVIPPIGFTPNPQQMVTLPVLLEPVGEAIAYGALLCTGVGLDKSADVSEIYVSLPTFSGAKKQFFKGVAVNLINGQQVSNPNNPLNGPQASNSNNLGVHLGSTMIKCKKYIENMCKGACNSGKCGQSLALGVACNHFCEQDYLDQINTCTKQFYTGQVLAKNALVGNLNADLNLMNSIPPIAY